VNVVLYILGIVILILGLAISIGIHEFGHLLPAKKFGVRVPNWAIGFGPKLFSKKIGETEYSIRAIPLGGFITMIGMYPPARPGKDDSKRPFSASIISARTAHAEHEQAGDENRKFYQLSAWKRIVVMFGGPFTNLLLGLILLTTAFAGVGQMQRVNTIAAVIDCQEQMVDSTMTCIASSVPTPAKLAGLQSGDQIRSIDGKQVSAAQDLSTVFQSTPVQTHKIVLVRDQKVVTLTLTPSVAKLPYADSTGKTAVDANGKLLLRDRAYIGVMWSQERTPVTLAAAFSRSVDLTAQTFGYIAQYPVQIYQTVSGLFSNEPRNPNGAVSIVGVGQAAGSIASNSNDSGTDRVFMLLYLVGALNIALFAFNMIPLPPLDGGHIAGAIYEYLKRGWFKLLGRKEKVTVDTALMAPFATFMFLVLFGAGILLMLVDFINPVQL